MAPIYSSEFRLGFETAFPTPFPSSSVARWRFPLCSRIVDTGLNHEDTSIASVDFCAFAIELTARKEGAPCPPSDLCVPGYIPVLKCPCHLRQRGFMSNINGDKAKHNVLRKMKIARRLRNRALFLTLQTDPTATRAAAAAPNKSASKTKDGSNG